VSALARFCVILDVQNSWFAERSFFLARRLELGSRSMLFRTPTSPRPVSFLRSEPKAAN